MDAAKAVGPALWLAGTIACGGPSPPTGDAAAAADPPAAQAAVVARAKIDNCAGVTAIDVAPIIGVQPAVIEPASEQQHSTLRICGYRARSSGESASFSLGWEPTVDAAKEEFARERNDLGMANQVIASASRTKPADAAYVDVLGLGDDAFRTSVNDTTVVRVGNVRVQVMMPSDPKKQTALAMLVVKGLR
jgi:hypothetical protein